MVLTISSHDKYQRAHPDGSPAFRPSFLHTKVLSVMHPVRNSWLRVVDLDNDICWSKRISVDLSRLDSSVEACLEDYSFLTASHSLPEIHSMKTFAG